MLESPIDFANSTACDTFRFKPSVLASTSTMFPADDEHTPSNWTSEESKRLRGGG